MTNVNCGLVQKISATRRFHVALRFCYTGDYWQTYTATLLSRSASFREVLRSVLGLRLPMMSAHGT